MQTSSRRFFVNWVMFPSLTIAPLLQQYAKAPVDSVGVHTAEPFDGVVPVHPLRYSHLQRGWTPERFQQPGVAGPDEFAAQQGFDNRQSHQQPGLEPQQYPQQGYGQHGFEQQGFEQPGYGQHLETASSPEDDYFGAAPGTLQRPTVSAAHTAVIVSKTVTCTAAWQQPTAAAPCR